MKIFVFVENGLGKNALALGAPPKAFCSERRERKNERKRSADIATRRHGIAVSKHGNDRPKGNALYPAMRKPQERRDK